MILKIVCLIFLAKVVVQANPLDDPDADITEQGTHLLVCHAAPLEIGIVLDSSASIYPPDFEKGKDFLEELFTKFEIGAGKTGARVSMITFGEGINKQDAFGLSSFEEKNSLLAAIDKVPFRGGGYTDTPAGIDYMTNVQLTQQQTRHWAERVGIVITDGESRNRKGPLFEKTKASAEAARASGIHMFAIGIGKAIERELLAIAGDPNRVFQVDSYDDLNTILNTLLSRTCIRVEKPPQTTCGEAQPADIYFVYNPAELGTEKTSWTSSFISKVIRQEEMDEGFRFGVVSGLCPVDAGFRLDAYDNANDIEKRLSNRTAAANLVDRVSQNGYFEATGGRGEAENVAVLVVNGGKKTKFLQDEVDRLTGAGTKVFVVDANHTGVNLSGATTLSGTSETEVALDLVGHLCPQREGDA